MDQIRKAKEDQPRTGHPPSLSRWVRSRFFPDLIVASPGQLDYRKLAEEGFRLVLLDIDNTLALHGSRTADDFARSVVERIEGAGLVPVITSNARRQRAETYAGSLGLGFIPEAGKPGIGAICRELSERDCRPDQALMIGDQLLTDIWSARRAGLPVILTDKRARSEIVTVRFKRLIEWLLIRLGGKASWKSLRAEADQAGHPWL